jgi:sugar lactone lactonase YvrE
MKNGHLAKLTVLCLATFLIAVSPSSAQPVIHEPGLDAVVFAQSPLLDKASGLAANADALYCSTLTGKVCRVSWEGDVQEVIDLSPSVVTLSGIDIDTNGAVLVGNASSSGTQVYEISPTGSVTLLRNDLASPTDILLEQDGSILAIERFGIRGVSRIARDGSSRTVIARRSDYGWGDYPTGVELDSEGNLYVATRSNGQIYRLTPEGDSTVFAGIPASNSEIALQFAPSGDLFATNDQTGQIFRISSDGTASLFASDIGRPKGITFDDAGVMYFTSQDDGVIYQVVPEPATMSLLALGGIALLKRRRDK